MQEGFRSCSVDILSAQSSNSVSFKSNVHITRHAQTGSLRYKDHGNRPSPLWRVFKSFRIFSKQDFASGASIGSAEKPRRFAKLPHVSNRRVCEPRSVWMSSA